MAKTPQTANEVRLAALESILVTLTQFTMANSPSRKHADLVLTAIKEDTYKTLMAADPVAKDMAEFDLQQFIDRVKERLPSLNHAPGDERYVNALKKLAQSGISPVREIQRPRFTSIEQTQKFYEDLLSIADDTVKRIAATTISNL